MKKKKRKKYIVLALVGYGMLLSSTYTNSIPFCANYIIVPNRKLLHLDVKEKINT